MHDHAPSRVPKLPKTGASQCTSKTALATHVDGQHRKGASIMLQSVYACRVCSLRIQLHVITVVLGLGPLQV
jgi:hypothetical protein